MVDNLVKEDNDDIHIERENPAVKNVDTENPKYKIADTIESLLKQKFSK